MSTADTPDLDEGTRCEFCGAEYVVDDEHATPPQPVPTDDEPAAEPATHCEWCGAPYPVPGEE